MVVVVFGFPKEGGHPVEVIWLSRNGDGEGNLDIGTVEGKVYCAFACICMYVYNSVFVSMCCFRFACLQIGFMF